MYSQQVDVDTDILDALNLAARQSPRAVNTLVQRSIQPMIERRIYTRITFIPGRPKYPLRWASARQRRFVMAKLQREDNLPYQRTGRTAAAWEITAVFGDGSGTIQAENPLSHARYVYGPPQQPYHEDTGWPNADVELLKISEEAADMLIDGWFSIIDVGKGVRLT